LLAFGGDVEHRVGHDVGKDLAKKATVAAMASYAEKYGQYAPETRWTSDFGAVVTFSVKGFTLNGKIEIEEREVVMDLAVPLLLRPFRGKALEVIEREITLWMTKAKNGEFD
jgi:hypothetical protein